MINLELVKKCSSAKVAPSYIGKLNFCTDTRNYTHPSAFVALPGMKVNPLNRLSDLLLQGCPVVFYQTSPENDELVSNLKKSFPKSEFIPVTDSITFLQELTHHHVKDWKNSNPKNTVFAISGSNGKTTHKEMLAFILNEVLPDKVVATEKNNNNHLGVPLTLLNVNPQTEIVVLELGSNHPGEIKVLCDIAVPNAGITTNIGATHLEFFGSEQKVFEEEAYLYSAVKNVTGGTGFFLINTDDKFLKTLESTKGSVTYGENEQAQAKITFLENGAEINYKNQDLAVANEHITGTHNKLNLITCLFIAHHFFPEHKRDFIEACKKFRPTKNRSEWIIFENRSIFLDAYNANPSSMKPSLSGFMESVHEQGLKPNEACIVLGDMNELGDSTPQYHEDVGKFAKDIGFTNVYFIGRFSSYYQRGFPEGKTRETCTEFKSEYRSECLKKFPIHFIKGSRSLQLESLFDIS